MESDTISRKWNFKTGKYIPKCVVFFVFPKGGSHSIKTSAIDIPSTNLCPGPVVAGTQGPYITLRRY